MVDTDFILDSQKEIYAAKAETGEIVALGAYRVQQGSVAVYIAYMESQPESNPTLTQCKKYQGIGKAMIAFGIQLSIDANCNGVVIFEAKTDELEQHYLRDFGARPVASFVEAVARKNYGIKQAKMNGVSVSTVEPFFGIHRAV